MQKIPTTVEQIHIHPISGVIELWVQWNDMYDGHPTDLLACWLDNRSVVIETQGPTPVLRFFHLDNPTYNALLNNKGGCLVLYSPHGVVDTLDFKLGIIWA